VRPVRTEEIFYNKAIGPRGKLLGMGTAGGRNVPARSRRPLAGIGRRELLRASFLGGSALVAAIACVAPALAGDEEEGAPRGEGPKLSGEVVERLARAFFDYEMPETDCDAVAGRAGPTIRTWHSIALRHLAPIDPPFDFRVVCAEAERLARKRG
jgi:hypothetical protein